MNEINEIKDKIIKFYNDDLTSGNLRATSAVGNYLTCFLKNFIKTDGLEIFFFSGAKTGTRSILKSLYDASYTICSHHRIGSFYHENKIDKKQFTIFDLIKYSCNFRIPVILDIYRDNLERTISSFFEFQYNFYKDKSIEELINIFLSGNNNWDQRLINLEMYEGSDEIVKYYNIKFDKFDFDKKYCPIQQSGIIFLKLRFKDLYMFDKIWYNLFNKKIDINYENQSCKKDYHDKYIQFLDKITITRDYYNKMINNENFLIFNSDKEIEEYKKKWEKKIKD